LYHFLFSLCQLNKEEKSRVEQKRERERERERERARRGCREREKGGYLCWYGFKKGKRKIIRGEYQLNAYQ